MAMSTAKNSKIVVTSEVEHLQKECDNFRDDMAYLKSQSTRNNLIFTDVPDVDGETPEVTETKLREHKAM
ncbi:hypothetical protein DPMN_120289 [Dreissena polymorpha]|uniref:Uncharacterized protein n=1 Tax=Dreissena polymorpha TaxID=45954 RepID=A0A9D4JRY7_DREPO|nr:hypothetical protein DPMN_120289 [Dreissena polymorpha]